MLFVFDVDGVLVSTSWLFLFDAYKELFARVIGKDYCLFFENLAEFKKWWCPDWKENLLKLGLPLDRGGEANAVFYEVVEPKVRLLSFMEPVLLSLKKKGHRLAIFTNRHRKSVLKHIFSVASLFEIIITADDVVNLKPDPEGILKILSELKIEKEKCVMIGDRPEDIRTGKNAGVKTAAVVWEHGLGEERDFEMIFPDVVLRTPQCFLEKLPSLSAN